MHSTNPIESSFSEVRKDTHKIKRHRGTKMAQRWLVTTLLDAEKHFRRVKGFEYIQALMKKTIGGLVIISLPERKAA